MKKMKKLVSFLLAAVMVLSMSVSVFAAESTYELTLNNASAGHTYTAYQIFKGDLSGDTLSNIEWGNGVTEEGQEALGTASAKAESLETVAKAEAFAAEVAEYLGTEAGSVTVGNNQTSGSITGLKAGYYLIKTTSVTAENGVYTYYIMKVVKNTTAQIKADVPTVDKTVDDSDANIGDTVTFTLTATMPSNIQGYEQYKVVFHDTMSDGLAFKEITSVTVAGTEIDEYTLALEEDDEELTVTITIADVLALGAKAGSEIVVTYTATLDEDAVIGTDGNSNKVYLEYSNDPNWDGAGDGPTGKTPEDEEKVYTWELPVFKYTGKDTPLAGAGFTLYRDAEYNTPVNVVKVVSEENTYKVCNIAECTKGHTHVTEIVTDDTGKFVIEGLEKGTYYLKETTTPAGYNTADVVTVVIGEDGLLTQNGIKTKMVAIQNNTGSELPETGGIGTTIFYVIGAVLVLGAGVLLVTRRRMNTEA